MDENIQESKKKNKKLSPPIIAAIVVLAVVLALFFLLIVFSLVLAVIGTIIISKDPEPVSSPEYTYVQELPDDSEEAQIHETPEGYSSGHNQNNANNQSSEDDQNTENNQLPENSQENLPETASDENTDYLAKREELEGLYGIGYDEGKVIRDFTVYDENGNPVKISSFAGKAVYINFFATWCSYCNYELPDIDRISSENPDDLIVILIDMQEDPSEVKQFAKQNNINHTIYYLNDWYADGLNIDAIPLSIVIDKYGYITGNCLGQADYNWMKNAVEDALNN